MVLHLAQRTAEGVLNEDLVTAASIALILASVLWVVLSRLILRNLRRAAHLPAEPLDKTKDIWKEPP